MEGISTITMENNTATTITNISLLIKETNTQMMPMQLRQTCYLALAVRNSNNPSINTSRKKVSTEEDEAWLNAAEEEKDYFPSKDISPSADKRSQSRILSEEGDQVISIKGEFSIHKDMGNDNLAE